MRTLLILASLLLLAACKPDAFAVLDQAEGHDALGGTVTLLAISSSVGVASSASSVQPSVEPPVAEASSSSSVYVPPLTEECLPGEKLFRVWDCGPDLHRVYW